MQNTEIGWVIINTGNPNSGRKYVVSWTFSRTRSEAIKKLIENSTKPWRWWKRNYNYKCVKSKSIIETINSETDV